MRRWLTAMLLLLPLVLTSGCATQALWTCSALDNRVEPAVKPNLRLYAATSPPDFLVVYDENSGRKHTNLTRAYFLNQNLDLIAAKRTPRFVNLDVEKSLSPVPVYFAPYRSGAQPPALPFAVSEAAGQSFTLYSKDGKSEFYHLPVYNNGTANFTRVALTPLAVTADVIVVGGEISFYCLLLYVESGGTSFP
jgi:hypothetical protein